MKCNNIYLSAISILSCLYGCSNDSLSIPEFETIDPYCEEIDEWGEEITASVEYVEDSEDHTFSVGFESKRESVSMSGQVAVTGGSPNLIIHDPPNLWLVITPKEETWEIIIDGTVQCAPKEASVQLLVHIDKESGVLTQQLRFDGLEYDGGVPETKDAGQ